MNKKTIFNTGLILLVTLIVLNGCESNTGFDNTDEYARIYMPQAREAPADHSLIMADTSQTIIYGAAYGAPGSLNNDIQINFGVDASVIDSINSAWGTSYALLPEASYELSQTTAVIPAGETSTEPLELDIATIGAIEPATGYLLPIRIESSNSVSVNKDLQTTYFLISGNFIEFNRSGWAIYDVDSEQVDPNPAPATNVFDGNPATFWHSEWSPNRPPHPHHVTIDLGETKDVHGLRIIGRENTTRGDPREIMIAVSNDGQNWENEETFSTLFDTQNEDHFYLSEVTNGQYIRITTNSSYMFPWETDLPIVHFAEVYAF